MARKATYKELEQRVKELEAAYEFNKRTLRESPVGISTYRPDGQCVSANKALGRILGATREQVLGQNFREIESWNKSGLLADAEEVLSTGIEKRREIHVHTTFGREVWFECYLSRFISLGEPYLFAMFNDITEHKQAEDALRESRKRYKELWDDAPVAYHMLDAEGIIRHVNRTETNILGYTREEMVGKPIFEFVLPEQRKDAEERFRLKLAGENVPKQDDRVYVKKDGSEIQVSIDDVVEHDGDGKVLGIRTTMIDISEQKLAEEALRKSEESYRTLAENLPGVVYRVFIREQNRTRFFNDMVLSVTGYKQEELCGGDVCSIDHLITPEDRDKVTATVENAIAKNKPFEIEYRLMHRDGGVRYLLERGKPVSGTDGEPLYVDGVIIDITDRKLMEEALKESSEKIKLFAYSVSHDLKSPATGIYGLARRLHKHYSDVLDERGTAYCDQMLKVAEQIAALVEMINVYISTKETPLNIETVKLKEIFQMVRDEFSAQLNVRQIKWLQTENAPEIKVDRLSILRTLRNLVDNAIKYGGDDLTEIRIGYEESDDFHIVRVSNDGVGIETGASERIFEVFRRNGKYEAVEGSGLGLAIVKEVAEQHGGKVWVKSDPEKGPTFYVSISRHL